MKTCQVIKQLQALGYVVQNSYVRNLLIEGYIDAPLKLGHTFIWSPENIEDLKRVLEQRGRLKKVS